MRYDPWANKKGKTEFDKSHNDNHPSMIVCPDLVPLQFGVTVDFFG